jgi:hypothetical protein
MHNICTVKTNALLGNILLKGEETISFQLEFLSDTLLLSFVMANLAKLQQRES